VDMLDFEEQSSRAVRIRFQNKKKGGKYKERKTFIIALFGYEDLFNCAL